VNGQSLSNLADRERRLHRPVAPGTPTTATAAATSTVEAVDLAIQKSIDNPDFSQGTVHTWTLHYRRAKYRYSTGTVVTDTVPAGLCPLGTLNYTTDGGADCNPRSGVGPSPAYSSVTETRQQLHRQLGSRHASPEPLTGPSRSPPSDRSDYPGPPWSLRLAVEPRDHHRHGERDVRTERHPGPDVCERRHGSCPARDAGRGEQRLRGD